MTEFTVKEVTVFTVATFLNEALKEVFNRANVDCQMWFTLEIISFDYSNFDFDSSYEIIVGKNVR